MKTFPIFTCLCFLFCMGNVLAYVPSLCSPNGGVCVDNEVNLNLSKTIDNITDIVFNPYTILEWLFTLWERFASLFQEEPKQQNIFYYIYRTILGYFGYKDEAESNDNYISNSAAFCVIVISYFCYVFVTSRYYKNCLNRLKRQNRQNHQNRQNRRQKSNLRPFIYENFNNDTESEITTYFNEKFMRKKSVSSSPKKLRQLK